jgi:diguanylate cyclase (GGDEF)-like protein
MAGSRDTRGDASTDSIELPARAGESGLTQTFEASTEGGALRRRASGRIADFEANVILIAHPENKQLGNRFRLGAGAVIEVGRAPSCEISLPEVLSISRTHAQIEHRGSFVIVKDLGSTNGTFVNDEIVRGERPIQSGDRIQVGAVHFKFLHERDVEHAYHEAIYNLVMRDGLTETFNQRKYTEEVEREVARARRYSRPLSLILFDIDHFKRLNDDYGHLCGDYVLKQLAARVRDQLRSEQVLARVGGEEFVILSPETDLEGAVALAEKLREQIASLELEYAGFKIRVTCSFGVAAYDRAMAGPEDLYRGADEALYTSKRAGRNRVSRAGAPAGE